MMVTLEAVEVKDNKLIWTGTINFSGGQFDCAAETRWRKKCGRNCCLPWASRAGGRNQQRSGESRGL